MRGRWFLILSFLDPGWRFSVSHCQTGCRRLFNGGCAFHFLESFERFFLVIEIAEGGLDDQCYLEGHLIGGAVVIVQLCPKSWEIFTPCKFNDIIDTLEDATKRVEAINQ